MEDGDWEAFTVEWLSSRRTPDGEYVDLRRYGGSGDRGLDVVAFLSDNDFDGEWDSYQCKGYAQHALRPTDIYVELAKIIYYSFERELPFNKLHRIPRKHVFVSPHGAGTTLSHLLMNPGLLRDRLRENWEKHARRSMGAGIDAELSGDFEEYFNAFAFSIFGSIEPASLIQEHARTPFHTPRFGGGLPPRPEPYRPPAEPTSSESLYIRKMLDAYGERLGVELESFQSLSDASDELRRHFDRQRELFYCAESLSSYSRDASLGNAFLGFQDEIYDGVYEIHAGTHDSGYARMRATIHTAGLLPMTGNALATVAHTRDKQGACHQLANDDRLTWISEND
jgi:hypothetical protein